MKLLDLLHRRGCRSYSDEPPGDHHATLTAIFDKYKIRPVFLVLVPIMAVGVLLTGGVFD